MGGGFYGGWRFTLQPLQAGSETKAEDVATLGRNLFSGMAKDPKTLDLLKRLNGDRTIAFVVVDVTQAEDKKRMEGPPGDDYMSILRVTEPQFDEGEKMPGSTLRFQVKASYFVSQNEGVQPSEFMPPLPLATFSLVLAMEDYVARHAPGWTVRDATFQYRGSNEKLPATIEEQRKDLDRWTQEYARKAREYYAGMAKN